ncbi:hypothetical protein L1887_44245 [Cichorium endivia]|nr:hypothetical protein L1887_44245 [Cichorium endivia]
MQALSTDHLCPKPVMRNATQNNVIRCLCRDYSGSLLGDRNIPVMERKLNMDINNKARIHWACRRGMRELDISIMPFFEYEYDTLSDDDKRLFVRLLESDDPDLFNWLMNHGKPADTELQRMVQLIQTRNRERGPVAI